MESAAHFLAKRNNAVDINPVSPGLGPATVAVTD